MLAFENFFGQLFLVLSLLISSCDSENPSPSSHSSLPEGPIDVVLLEDSFRENSMVIVGSVTGQFIVAYYTLLDGDTLNFEPTLEALPAVMQDDEGNVWDIFGEAIAGPREGEKLSGPDQFNGFWFAWGAFFPNVQIYGQPDSLEQPDRLYSDGAWLIPSSEIRDGGPGKDGIPYLIKPQMKNALTISYLKDHDLILGTKRDGEVRGYPHPILDWHEIINDNSGDESYSITYCPLTGTGIGWNRNFNNQVNLFGVSGLLYNTNLLPYDRNTDSYWSQIRMECVYGDLKGEKIKTYPVVEMNWRTWKTMFPDSKVVSRDTGHSRNYGNYPYGSYKTNNSLIFPVDIVDQRLSKKEIVHGIVINDKAKVYRFSDFE